MKVTVSVPGSVSRWGWNLSIDRGVFKCNMCSFHSVASLRHAKFSLTRLALNILGEQRRAVSRGLVARRTAAVGSWCVRCELSDAWVQIYLNAFFSGVFRDRKLKLWGLCHMLRVVSAYLNSEGCYTPVAAQDSSKMHIMMQQSEFW